jgi:aldose 1-epimerase
MILNLTSGDSAVTVCPQIGGSIAQFTWRGHDVLRPAPDTAIRDGLVRQMGFYPLVPYSNRIGYAELIVNTDKYRLRANAPPEPHALHGFGWQREWQVKSHSDHAATLSLIHEPDTDWPFACDATEHISFAGDSLHLRLQLTNTDTRAMPAGLGFHPFFPINDETSFEAAWQAMWAMGGDKLPIGRVEAPPEANFRQSRQIKDWQVDNCFTGWSRHAVLEYPSHRVQIDADENCRQLVCFAPNDGRNFIALEPVSHVNNAFALAAAGVGDTGTRILAPGQTLAISMSIRPCALLEG